jgi:ATP adenylyltransferase
MRCDTDFVQGSSVHVHAIFPEQELPTIPLAFHAITLSYPMRMLLGLSETLPSLVEAKFKTAKATSSLLFSLTEVAVIRTSSGIPVRVPRWP